MAGHVSKKSVMLEGGLCRISGPEGRYRARFERIVVSNQQDASVYRDSDFVPP